MAKPVLTRSAALHKRLCAFVVVFTAFAVNFEPTIEFALTLVTSALLARL